MPSSRTTPTHGRPKNSREIKTNTKSPICQYLHSSNSNSRAPMHRPRHQETKQSNSGANFIKKKHTKAQTTPRLRSHASHFPPDLDHHHKIGKNWVTFAYSKPTITKIRNSCQPPVTCNSADPINK